MLIEHEEISTKLDQAVSLFSRLGQTEYRGVVFPASVRMPFFTYAYVEALTAHAGGTVSRNRTMCELLAVGIDAVLEAMPPEDRRAVEVLFQDIAVVAAESDNNETGVV